MPNSFDLESVKQLREVAEKIPPQTGPRATKALADLKTAVAEMERGAKK